MTQGNKINQVHIPKLFMRGSFQPETLDANKRSVTVLWSTGEKVLRGGIWEDPFYEELSLDPQSVRLGRLNNGAPVLNSHASSTLGDQLGVVDRAWIEDGLGYAQIRFSERDDVQPVFKDIQNGIIRNVSVGYRVFKFQDVSGENDAKKTMRAIDWEPMELSMVPIGADSGASVRSDKENLTTCEILERTNENRNKEKIMSEPIVTEVRSDTAVKSGAVIVDVDAIRKETEQVVSKRASEIYALARKHQIDDAVCVRLIESGANIEKARAEILDVLAERSQKSAIDNKLSGIEVGKDNTVESRRSGAVESLLHRYDPNQYKVTDKGFRFVGLSLSELARSIVSENGIKVEGMPKSEIIQRAFMSTSDFPSILANVANKTLRQAYELAPQTFRPFVRVTTVPDFKPTTRAQLGEGPKFEPLGQGGEYRKGALNDSGEQVQLGTYGKWLNITRQVIINDDLNAFTRVSNMMGRAAADLESDLVYKVFTGNLALSDAIALFHASHGNLGTTGVPSEVTLTEARKLMRLQTGLQTGKDKQFLNLQAKYIIVPAALETTTQKQLAQIVPNQSSSVNIFTGTYQLIVEPRLDATSATVWYMAADPSQIDTIELAYLQDQQGVYTETQQGWEIDGLQIKARLDVAAKAIDFRGLFKSP